MNLRKIRVRVLACPRRLGGEGAAEGAEEGGGVDQLRSPS